MTESERATRVAASQGYAPAFLLPFSEAERSAVAELCDDAGVLVEGVAGRFLAILDRYRGRLAAEKAVDAEADTQIDE